MSTVGSIYKQADWKSEKHVPVIEAPARVAAEEVFEVKVCVGAEIAHPNTTEHHIRWIRLHFLPAGASAAFEVANLEFTAHGESVEGANKGPVYTHHKASAYLKLGKGGSLIATSYCNIHGLWENAQEIQVG